MGLRDLTKYQTVAKSDRVPTTTTDTELRGAALQAAVRQALDSGTIRYSRHAMERMAERGYLIGDVINCLTRGRCRVDGRDHEGDWKYIAEWQQICVVFVLTLDEEGNSVLVITVHAGN